MISRPGKISVICNNAVNINPGVSSEQLAFKSIAVRHGYTDVSFFELLSKEEHFSFWNSELKDSVPLSVDSLREFDSRYCDGIPIKFERLLEAIERVATSSAIVIWCGWVHSTLFYDYYLSVLTKSSIARDESEAQEIIGSNLYLTTQPSSVLARSISFGQSLLFNTITRESDRGYGLAYKSFYERAGKVYMRDFFSAAKVARLRAELVESRACVDCAMLLRDEDVDRIPRTATQSQLDFCRNKIGVFFGRSNLDLKSALSVVEALSRILQRRPFSLGWGATFSFPQTQNLPFPAPGGRVDPVTLVGDSLSMIRNSYAVISDTYHICVNSWAMGVPAICVGSNFSNAHVDANSGYRYSPIDKRYLLYAMIDALDFYVHEAEFADQNYLEAHIEHIADLIRSDRVAEIHSRLRKGAEVAETKLTSHIDQLIM